MPGIQFAPHLNRNHFPSSDNGENSRQLHAKAVEDGEIESSHEAISPRFAARRRTFGASEASKKKKVRREYRPLRK
jgi:hypothetical protein